MPDSFLFNTTGSKGCDLKPASDVKAVVDKWKQKKELFIRVKPSPIWQQLKNRFPPIIRPGLLVFISVATNTRPSLYISTSWICTFTCASYPCCHRYHNIARTPQQTWPNIAQAGVTDTEVIIAAILHDTVEDTDTSLEEVEAEFGKAVRDIVAEVSDDKTLAKAERKRLQIVHSPHKSRQVGGLSVVTNMGISELPGECL